MKQRSSAGKILLTIIIVIAVLLLLAEFGLRWFIGNQVVQALATQDTQTSSEQKEKPKISFGTSPLLLGLFKGAGDGAISRGGTGYVRSNGCV